MSSARHLLIQLAGIVNFTYGINFQMFQVNIPNSVSKTRNLYGGPWKYLTFINLWVQLLYFSLGLIDTFVSGHHSASGSRLRRLRDGFFATVAFPIGMFVGLIFWALYLIDRNLIFPEVLDKYIPPFENHVLHTSVLFLQVFELFSSHHIYPSKKTGMAVTGLFCFAYLAWVCYIAYAGGFWVYPVFKVLTPIWRFLFMLSCSVLGGILYLAGGWLNDRIWSKGITTVRSRKKKD